MKKLLSLLLILLLCSCSDVRFDYDCKLSYQISNGTITHEEKTFDTKDQADNYCMDCDDDIFTLCSCNCVEIPE